MRARREGWVAVLCAVVGLLAGLGPIWLAVTARPAWAFMFTVEVHDRQFSPKLSEIEVGDKVRWRWRDQTKDADEPDRHSITADSDNWDYDETLAVEGAEAELKFREPGEYRYYCRYVDGMAGTILVKDPDAPPPTTATTAPPTTTTTTAPTTTTTARPSTTTTTAPPTTTSTEPRPPAGTPPVPPPPVPATAAAPPATLATSSTTTVPTSSTTTLPPTTATNPPSTAGEEAAPPSTAPEVPPSTGAPPADGEAGGDMPVAAGLPTGDSSTDPATVVLVAALVAVGLFGTWTLIRVRPGRV